MVYLFIIAINIYYLHTTVIAPCRVHNVLDRVQGGSEIC